MTSRQEEREQRLRNNAVLKISRHQPKIVGILHDREEGCQEGHQEGCQQRSQVHAVLKISRHRPKSSASSTRQRRKAARDRKHHDDVDFRRKDVGTRFGLSKATLSLDRNLRAKPSQARRSLPGGPSARSTGSKRRGTPEQVI